MKTLFYNANHPTTYRRGFHFPGEILEQFFGETGFANPYAYPKVQVYGNEDGSTLLCELPGVKKDNLEIAVKDHKVTISGKKEKRTLEPGFVESRRETSFGEFSRTIEFPYRIDEGNVRASLKDGILELQLSKREEEKPKRIEIQGE